MVTPNIHMASTLDAPGMIVGMCFEEAVLLRCMNDHFFGLRSIQTRVVFSGPCDNVLEFIRCSVKIAGTNQQLRITGVFNFDVQFMHWVQSG